MTVKYEIKEVSADNIKELQQISRQTFLETFGSQNSAENMKEFLDTAYAEEKLKDEVENANSSFYFLTVDNKVAGYLKVNEGHAQTEQVVPNALEVERIYLKQAFQHQGLGLVLIKLAEKIAKEKEKDNMWLGVWEKNYQAQAFYEKDGFKRVKKITLPEIDDEDFHAIHVFSLNDGKDDALATCRIFKDENGDWYLGRVVVSKDARGMHLGSKMMKEVHEYLKEKDVNRIYCHAQMTAKPFYDRLGYQLKGETFDEGGIEHVLMYKDL